MISHLTDIDGFTTDEAEYAADRCGVDWNEQALISVKLYLERFFVSPSYNMPYPSRAHTLNYLIENELFTDEEAAYAVDKCEADWREYAVESARVFSDRYSTANEEEKISWVKSDLEDCEFTAEEIDHAISVVFGA